MNSLADFPKETTHGHGFGKSPEKEGIAITANDITAETTNSISSEVKGYIRFHKTLAQNVQNDISDWSEKTVTDIGIETTVHFEKEQAFLQKLRTANGVDFFNNIDNFEKEYKRIPTSDSDFDMRHYQKMLQEEVATKKNPIEIKKYTNAYFQALLKSLTENFNARKADFEQKLIDGKRKQFLKELYEKIENFRRLEQILQPFIDDLSHGYLWDLSKSSFRNLGFDILAKYASLLKNDKALQELADLLGKQSVTSQKIEKEIIEETVIKSSYHPRPAVSGNIVGFDYSNEISRVVPSEISLLNIPETEYLFYLRFVEKQLLSYQYSQIQDKISQQKEIEVSKSEDITGPIIICVDTSGSMQGVPEQTAKIAALALAKIAMKGRRNCFLISFSTNIETLDLSDFKKKNSFEFLVSFLNKSFNGGTDATPALKECLRQLKTKNYKNADVLIISDFVMASLPENIISGIEAEQDNGTLFYSLVIGDSANDKAIEYFDENIIYNPYDEKSRQEFYKKIRQMALLREKHSQQ